MMRKFTVSSALGAWLLVTTRAPHCTANFLNPAVKPDIPACLQFCFLDLLQFCPVPPCSEARPGAVPVPAGGRNLAGSAGPRVPMTRGHFQPHHHPTRPGPGTPTLIFLILIFNPVLLSSLFSQSSSSFCVSLPALCVSRSRPAPPDPQ